MSEYKLSIKLSGGSPVISVSHQNGASVALSAGSKNLTAVALTKLDFVKKIYHPGVINAELSLKDNVPDAAGLKKLFAGASVDMSIEGEEYVAQGYVVADAAVQKRAPGGTAGAYTYMELRICSPDYRLDEAVYSRAYTGRSLGSVIMETLPKFGMKSDLLNKNLQYLSHKRKQIVKDKNGKDKEEEVVDELIQPYMVQYNETFYSFARRVANRCGEFLYYEDGKFNLGLVKHPSATDNEEEKETIANYRSASFHDRRRNEPSDITDFYRDPVGQSSTAAGKNGSYNMEASYDEYLCKISRKGYDDTKSEYNAKYAAFPTEIVAASFNASSLIQASVNLAVSQSKAWAVSAIAASNQNKAFEKAFSDGEKAMYDTGNKDFSGHYNRMKGKNGQATECAQFSTHPGQNASSTKRDINNALLSAVRTEQEKLWDRAVEVDLGDKLISAGLGWKICFSYWDTGADKDTDYIVVEVSGGWSEDSGWKDCMKIVAVPDRSTTTSPAVPPSIEEDAVIRSGPQTARISTASMDPKRLGRVRVRYWWQSDSDDQSPWIRVSTLNATKGGGTYFMPEVGDECLVGFECGNMERPYVMGYLNNGTRATPYGTRDYSDVISNGGGQTIRIKDCKDDTVFLTGLAGLSLARSIFNFSAGTSVLQKLSGFIEFTDEYGIFNVKMSSADRKISINSPFGSVEASAFTGITLSAPNGEVKIIGKNIDISAGNNLTVTSGVNITDRMHHKNISGIGDAASSAVSAIVDTVMGEILDLGLLRCLVETFMKPVAGNLTVRSGRYLTMEAGPGRASLPIEAYDYKFIQDYPLEDTMYNPATVLNDIPMLVEKLDQLFKDRKDCADKLSKLIVSYKDYDGKLNEDDKYWHVNVIKNAGNSKYEDSIEDINNFHCAEGKPFTDPEAKKMRSSAKDIDELAAKLMSADGGLPAVAEAGTFMQPKEAAAAFKEIEEHYSSRVFAVDELISWDSFTEEAEKLPSKAPAKNVRHLLWAYLKQFTGMLGGSLKMKLPDAEDDDFTSEEKWKAKLSEIEPIDKNLGYNLLRTLPATIWDNTISNFTNAFKDYRAWSQDSKGEIIMSQQKDKVIRFGESSVSVMPSPSLDVIINECIIQGRDER